MYRLVIGVACVLACGKTEPGETPRLVTEAEIAAHEAALMKRISETKARTCKRPLLRGQPLPGPGADDLRALAQPTGELADCDARLAKLGDLNPLVEARDATLLAIQKECGPRYEAALVKAISHEDACSPFQVGVDRVAPQTTADLTRALRTAKFLAIHARERSTDDPLAAMWLLLDAMRFSDDLSRGHTTLIDRMIGIAATGLLADQAFAILAKSSIAADKLAELSTAFGVLTAYQQPFTDTLRGERDYGDLVYALGPLKPKNWVPPGGWPEGQDPRGAERGELLTRNPRDEHALHFFVSERTAREVAKACPSGGTLEACAKGFGDAEATPKEPDPASFAKLYAKLAAAKNVDQARLEIRDAMVDILDGVARPAYSAYVRKQGRSIAKLAALRIHLELARHAATANPCRPALVEIPDELLAPPQLGGRLKLIVTSDAVEIAAPAWTTHTDAKDAPPPAWKCPAK